MKSKEQSNSVIIVEGVDGSGKTSVCELLSKATGYPIVKMPRMKEFFSNNAEEMSKFFNEIIVQIPRGFVLDRGFPSSLVYSKVYNREFDLSYIKDIEKKLKANIFILTATEKILKSRKNDEIIQGEMLYRINEEYLKLAVSKNWKVIDTSNITPSQVSEIILATI